MEHNDDDQPLRAILPATASTTTHASIDTWAPRVASRYVKKRSPVTNVACQECRKRKTKCDGQRPRCSKCCKREIQVCEYDMEGSQANKISIYKSRIEQQSSQIEQLETEIARLRKESLTGSYEEPSPPPFPGVLGRSPVNSSFPPISPSLQMILNPEIQQDAVPLLQREAIAFAHGQGAERERYNREEVLKDQNRIFQNENTRLKELVVLLTLLGDRTVAQRMALRIQQEGVTNDLLAEANQLMAKGCISPFPSAFAKAPKTSTAEINRLPALSSLDLPTMSVPYAPELQDLDPTLRNYASAHPAAAGPSRSTNQQA